MEMDYQSMSREELEYFHAQDKKRKKNTVLGIIVMLLAILGVVITIVFIAHNVKEKKEEEQEALLNSYNSFLIPVAAIDPTGFDDITTAPMSELIKIAVWSIIDTDLDPNAYDYSSGNLAIPVAEVEAAFSKYFGNQVQIEHTTVEGYGYCFTYNKDNSCYYIPLTGIAPVYTPKVVSVSNENGVTKLVCGLVYASAWQQDYSTGKMVSPDPDKYIAITIRAQSGGTYIGSISSSGKPETA